MAETAFYILGGIIVVLALVISAIGLRWERFPLSRRAALGVTVPFAALVVGASAFAWVHASEHQRDYAAQHAEERAAAAEERAAQLLEEIGAADGEPEAAPADPDPAADEPADTTLELTSPEDGSLVFDTDDLAADAGLIEILYVNPSPVPHDVAIEDDGETIADGEIVTDGGTSIARAELEPGAYVFYCTVPGHREGGMEGELTVR